MKCSWAILKEMLAPNQYAENVAIKPRGSERVEFALKLPGKCEVQPVWLPIDAKFPQEDFQRLIEAREEANLERQQQQPLAAGATF